MINATPYPATPRSRPVHSQCSRGGLAPFYSAAPIFGSWNGKSWKDA
jgi:hypothetical protein